MKRDDRTSVGCPRHSGLFLQAEVDAAADRPGRRDAYTLVEMLIAVVLVTTLLSAVWGILSLYNSLLTAGADATSRQQLVRSLFQLMDEDFRQVVLPVSPADSTGGADSALSGSASGSLAGEPESEFVDLALSEAPSERTGDSAAGGGSDPSLAGTESPAGDVLTVRVRGSATALQLSVRQPVVGPAREGAVPGEFRDSDRDLNRMDLTLDDPLASERTDVREFQTIVYQFERPGPPSDANTLPGGLYRVQTATTSFQELLTRRSTAERNLATDDIRLSRPSLELLVLPNPEDERTRGADAREGFGALSDSPDTRAMAAELDFVPEVVGCRFRYFDGQTWQSTWGPDSATAVPLAISVELDVLTAADLATMATLTGSRTSLDLVGSGSVDGVSADPQPDGSLVPPPSEPAVEAEPIQVAARRFRRVILLRTPSQDAPLDMTSPADELGLPALPGSGGGVL